MKRLNEKNQVIGVAGIGLLTILALFLPAAALPGFSVTATSGDELALSTGGVLANGAVASVAGTISIAGIAGNGSGDGEPEQPSNKEKVNDNYLKNKGFDGHKVKEETRGTTKDGSKYDIYVDKDTGQLWVFRKGGKGEGIPTGEYIK